MQTNVVQTFAAPQTLTPITVAERALAAASTPAETRRVEALAAAAKAWARERDDYELTVAAARVYIAARCRTTELVMPHIRQGQYGREGIIGDTFLADFNLTKLQWQRRRAELDAFKQVFNKYIDDCIASGAVPTSSGLVKFLIDPQGVHVSDDSTPRGECPECAQVPRAYRNAGGSWQCGNCGAEVLLTVKAIKQ